MDILCYFLFPQGRRCVETFPPSLFSPLAADIHGADLHGAPFLADPSRGRLFFPFLRSLIEADLPAPTSHGIPFFLPS